MEITLELIKLFEKINNISISITIHGDGSCSVKEFWDEETFKTFKNISELHYFLKNSRLKKDKNGLSLSPIKIL